MAKTIKNTNAVLDLGHWHYPGTFNPEDWQGFIYRIVDLDTGREYIGKKFFSYDSKKLNPKTNRFKHTKKSSDWRKYTGSSRSLNREIAARGKSHFEFFIESLHENRTSLTFAELEKHIFEDVLRARLPDGSRKFYNKVVMGVPFMPHPSTPKEVAARVFHQVRERDPNGLLTWRSDLTLEQREQLESKYRIGNKHSLRGQLDPQEYQRQLDALYNQEFPKINWRRRARRKRNKK